MGVVVDLSGAPCGAIKPPQKRKRVALGFRTVFPELYEGKFVRVFQELSDQWAARRDPTVQQPVKRHLKLVGKCDDRSDSALIFPRLDSSDSATGNAHGSRHILLR